MTEPSSYLPPATSPTSAAAAMGQASSDPPAAWVSRCGDRFRLFDPELRLVCDSDDLASAYRALEDARKNLVHGDAGDASTGAAAPHARAASRLSEALGLVTALGRPLAFLIAVILGMAIAQLGSSLAGLGRTVSTYSDVHDAGRAGLDHLHALATAAENLSPERSEQIQRDLRVIVSRLAPFAHELAPLLPGPANRDDTSVP